mmetsp:Transcript_23078/g.55913  ORF Transcript_23078/g.55913 Transcript_23078/m.55913 type:complete len:244 (+) Transcript_23078:2066-2797(+)
MAFVGRNGSELRRRQHRHWQWTFFVVGHRAERGEVSAPEQGPVHSNSDVILAPGRNVLYRLRIFRLHGVKLDRLPGVDSECILLLVSEGEDFSFRRARECKIESAAYFGARVRSETLDPSGRRVGEGVPMTELAFLAFAEGEHHSSQSPHRRMGAANADLDDFMHAHCSRPHHEANSPSHQHFGEHVHIAWEILALPALVGFVVRHRAALVHRAILSAAEGTEFPDAHAGDIYRFLHVLVVHS